MSAFTTSSFCFLFSFSNALKKALKYRFKRVENYFSLGKYITLLRKWRAWSMGMISGCGPVEPGSSPGAGLFKSFSKWKPLNRRRCFNYSLRWRAACVYPTLSTLVSTGGDGWGATRGAPTFTYSNYIFNSLNYLGGE